LFGRVKTFHMLQTIQKSMIEDEDKISIMYMGNIT
jgi:hypothetical protein